MKTNIQYIINQIQNGTVVKHFKYETITEEEKKKNKYVYRVLCTNCIDTETNEELVIYQALYEPYTTFARPRSLFFSSVDKEKYPYIRQRYRFERF